MPFGNYTSASPFVTYALTKNMPQKRTLYRKRRARTRRRANKMKPLKSRSAKEQVRLAKLNTRVKNLSRSMKSDQARHTHRLRYTNTVGASVAQVNNSDIMKFRTTEIEQAMANFRYYNPAIPGTLTTADASTGTYNRAIHIESVYDKLTVRNNYQVPALVTVWSCVPKNDTSIAPTSFYSSGVTDQTISMAVTSPNLYPTDIDDVRNNWSFKRAKQMLLMPGRQFVVTRSAGAFDYDPSNVDHHNLVFQKKYRAHQWCLRVEGVTGHDTTLGEYSSLAAQVDYVGERKTVFTYDAGTNLNDFSETDAAGTFTNGGVVSNMPVSDNQQFSTA